MPVSFGILGPLEVSVNGRPVRIGGRQRALLVTLLLHTNKIVGFAELVEAIWGDSAPVHPRAAVHTSVTRLRNVLGEVVIEGSTDGYRIVLDEQAVDLHRFESAVLAAQAAGEREAEVLGEALSMWRGEPLADVQSDFLQRHEVPRLVEQRLQALERKFELDLAAGGHDAVVTQLQALTAEHPLRERFWALLITALYRCGRQADALAAYASVRRHLVDELGVEPGPQLRQAYQQVLVGEETSWQVECQLPIDVSDFTNRDDELSRVIDVLRSGDGVPIVVVTGPPGMGKSALVVRAAHRLIADYPDGQWFLRLNGAGSAPRPAMDLLAEMLRTAGVDPKAIPAGLDTRSSLLRSRLAQRRVLLVLDDAAGADQVAPLLPGRPGSAVVVTSRSGMAGLSALYGGIRMPLRPLSAKHSYELLARIVGSGRCEREQIAADELTSLCGRLPLALRIVAANLAARPGMRITQYATDLRTGDRIGKLRTQGETGVAVRAAFDLSYRALSDSNRRGFCLLGLVPGPDISTAAAAALFGCPVSEAAGVLDDLVAANLLEYQDEDRFRFHDLIRAYAAGLFAEEAWDSADAFRRLADWYLHTVHAANQCLASVYVSQLGPAPSDVVPLIFQSDGEALRWLAGERLNYLAIIEQAAVSGPVRFTWQLADAARPDLHNAYRVAELEKAAGLGLSCARDVGERRGEAMMLLALGALKGISSRYDEAITDLTECRRIAVQLGETGIVATAVISCAASYTEAGLPVQAGELAAEGLALVDQGVEQGEGRRFAALVHLGESHRHLGRLNQAYELYEAAGQVAPSAMSELVLRCCLGYVYRDIGDYEAALEQFQWVLDTSVFWHTAHDECSVGVASIYCELGKLDLGFQHANAALARAKASGYGKFEAEANIVLGALDLATGRPGPAFDSYEKGRDLARALHAKPTLIAATIGMAIAANDTGLALQAIDLARESGMRLYEAKALTALARVQLAQHRFEAARESAEAALAMFVEFGSRPGQEQAQAVLSAC